MNLEILRKKSTDFSITGKLSIDGVFECYTLERPFNDPDWKPIPEGKYMVIIRFSPRFGMDVPEIMNVPGRTDIEIHPGNKAPDSHGCVLVGKQIGDDIILESRLAFSALMVKLNSVKDPIFVTVLNQTEQEKV